MMKFNLKKAGRFSAFVLAFFMFFTVSPLSASGDQAGGDDAQAKTEEQKVVYLTFDDGPGTKVTPQILDILKEEEIKATFFVLGVEADRNPEMLRRVYEEGHRIANHTYGHDYDYLYEKPENVVADIEKAEESINRALGFDYGNRLFRFPGGSSQRDPSFREAVAAEGYEAYGWNSSGEDSVSKDGASAQEILANVISSAGDQNEVTVLLHDNDGKDTTAEALPEIIKYFKEKGYEFRTL